ncbi:transmembrane protein 216-like [Bemisia tabaci]|uniref:transmembrane protein 216-like n=1 Tax=Bemisia tabaci TaxID=7038 RepID=UPI0008F9AF30|nr:PREDICTED: transmembrane protein 216-like [Bemisia tabaci]
MQSSLALEVLMYLNSYYFGMFALCEVMCGIFKVIHLPYSTGTIFMEFFLLLFLSCVEGLRLFFAHKGNLTEKCSTLFFSVILLVPSTFGVLYFLYWQTYILRLEVMLCYIQLCLLAVEFILSLVSLSSFFKNISFSD